MPRDASFREMEAAYWRLAGEKRTLLALLNEAYEVLGNAERRLAYNAEREQAPPRERLANRDAERSGLPGLRERLNWHLR